MPARFLLSQPNARVHVTLGLLAAVLGLVLRLSPAEFALLALTIGFVLAMEALNTAVEASLDLLHPDRHPLAGLAKDTAAAAVLIAALAAVAVGALLFVPPLWALFVR